MTVRAPDLRDFEGLCEVRGVWARRAGVVAGEAVEVQGLLDLPLGAARSAFEGGLAAVLDG